MRNNALPFTGATLVLGIFAAFLRWVQNMGLYDEATGLARRGAGISYVLLFYALLCAVAFAALTVIWLRRCRCPAETAEALRSPGILPVVVTWLCAAVYVAGALLLLFAVPGEGSSRLRRVFAAAAIFGGLCFPFLPQQGGQASSVSRTAAAVLPLVSAFALVYFYMSGAREEPTLWRTAPEALALAAAALGFLGVGGFLFGVPRPRLTLFSLQLAAFFSIGISFDSHGAWRTAMFAALAGMCLLLEWLIVYNLKER